MALYKYQALDERGQLLWGYINGSTHDDAFNKLVNRKLDPIVVFKKFDLFGILRSKSAAEDIERFFMYLEYSLDAGVSITQSLRNIAPSFNKGFQAIVLSIQDDIYHGQMLSKACESFPFIFHPITLSLIKIGEQSGKLSDSCRKIQEYLKLQRERRSKIAKALRYPIFSFVSFIMAAVFFVTFFLPDLMQFFAAYNIQPSFCTALLVCIVEFPILMSLEMLLLLVAFLLAIYILFKPQSGIFFGKVFFSFFPFAKIIADAHYSRFLQSLSILCGEHMRLVEAIVISKDTVSSSFIRRQLDVVYENVISGRHLYEALGEALLFRPFYARIIQTGEETGRISQALYSAYEVSYRDTESTVSKIIALAEPTLLIVIGAMFLFLVNATIVPLYEHLGAMSYE
ncbi:type II secretion system F family protein [Candidatus Hydrogenosomobacter endosymbioticus]|uniref:Type IV pilin biogenesis protein n=1 Tax=Candidatus Hydrogenosomobacter endosymbioticus TaxID=2558174 RepID=A0ABM7VA90_9PROT|nr:type II secretion system F family protein [Candidatus Hydrogenosomobacter endosymbioticus]BDB96411.1 type IV pilin biogenesis protein [Candidatus Hydrogenosomobacter endosymbioticus]